MNKNEKKLLEHSKKMSAQIWLIDMLLTDELKNAVVDGDKRKVLVELVARAKKANKLASTCDKLFEVSELASSTPEQIIELLEANQIKSPECNCVACRLRKKLESMNQAQPKMKSAFN